MEMREPLVVDWDGTMTEVDGLHLVLSEFGDVDVYAQAEERLGRSLTLHEVIAFEIETVRAPLADVVAWVRENVRSVPASPRSRDVTPLVVSSGFHELIEPVLEREGMELEVARTASTRVPRVGGRSFATPRRVRVCGEPCKRSDVAGIGDFVYVGDGFSDRCVAQAATRVFARDGLAEYLPRDVRTSGTTIRAVARARRRPSSRSGRAADL